MVNHTYGGSKGAAKPCQATTARAPVQAQVGGSATYVKEHVESGQSSQYCGTRLVLNSGPTWSNHVRYTSKPKAPHSQGLGYVHYEW